MTGRCLRSYAPSANTRKGRAAVSERIEVDRRELLRLGAAGAGLAVMETLEEIGEADKAEAFVVKALAEKRLLMGFGHRVYYRSGDPRAALLIELAEEACRRHGEEKWFDIARALNEAVHSRKGIIPNVDFYSAPLWRGMGLAPRLFVPIIAVSRVAGWCANILEQQAGNRLIRPRAAYTGPAHRPYKTLRRRK